MSSNDIQESRYLAAIELLNECYTPIVYRFACDYVKNMLDVSWHTQHLHDCIEEARERTVRASEGEDIVIMDEKHNAKYVLKNAKYVDRTNRNNLDRVLYRLASGNLVMVTKYHAGTIQIEDDQKVIGSIFPGKTNPEVVIYE